MADPLDTMIGAGDVKFKMTKPVVDADYRDMGECDVFSVAVTSERKQFKSKKTSARKVVRSEQTDQASQIGVTFNELNADNLGIYMLGTVADPVGPDVYSTISILAAGSIEGYVRFVGTTTIGKKVQVDALVNLQPNGEVDLLIDDWAGLQLEGETIFDATYGMGRMLVGIAAEVT